MDRGLFFVELQPVGASLLAMDVNDNACFLNRRVAFESIASKLAPTGSVCNCRLTHTQPTNPHRAQYHQPTKEQSSQLFMLIPDQLSICPIHCFSPYKTKACIAESPCRFWSGYSWVTPVMVDLSGRRCRPVRPRADKIVASRWRRATLSGLALIHVMLLQGLYTYD